MRTNIEVKARLNGLPAMMTKLAELTGAEPIKMLQEDVYFNIPRGRLKLRRENSTGTERTERTELIYYARNDDVAEPRHSHYEITQVSNFESMHGLLKLAFGIAGRVVKNRALFQSGNIRFHADSVDGLGAFFEMEACITEADDPDVVELIVKQWMNDLKIRPDYLVAGSYLDLVRSSVPLRQTSKGSR